MKLGRRENILLLCFAFVLDCAARGRIRRHSRWSAVGVWQGMKFYPHSSYVLALAAGGFRSVFRYSTPPLAVASDGAYFAFRRCEEATPLIAVMMSCGSLFIARGGFVE